MNLAMLFALATSTSFLVGPIDPLPPALARELHASQFPTRAVGTLKNVRHPSNVIFGGNDWIYVASFMHNQVMRIRYRQAAMERVGAGAAAPQRELFASGRYCAHGQPCATLDGPWGLAERRGRLYVANFGTDHVLVFNVTDRAFVAAFGGSTVLNCPEGLAFDEAGRLYVASFLTNDVAVFNASRSEKAVTRGGSGLSERFEVPVPLPLRLTAAHLRGPEGVAYDVRHDHILVASHYNQSVLRFSARTGALVAVLGPNEQVLDGPVGVAFDNHGNVFATAYRRNNIVRYANDGGRGAFMGIFANARGMRGPSGLAFDESGTLLVVASYDNSRLFFFNTTHADRVTVARVLTA